MRLFILKFYLLLAGSNHLSGPEVLQKFMQFQISSRRKERKEMPELFLYNQPVELKEITKMKFLVCFKFVYGPDIFSFSNDAKNISRPGSFSERLSDPKVTQFLSSNQPLNLVSSNLNLRN